MGKYIVVDGKQVTIDDIAEAVSLDKMVYEEEYFVTIRQCQEWYRKNPQIYTMVKDTASNSVIAYINASPVTHEYYEKIRSGEFIDAYLPADAIVAYDFPDIYNLYFSSIVVHPDYQNSTVFMTLFNAIVEKFLQLGRQEIMIASIVADAVSEKGEKFCRLFGMEKLKTSSHESSIFEIQMIPPKFRISSKATKKLYDYYLQKSAGLVNDKPLKTENHSNLTTADLSGKVFISYSTEDKMMATKVCDYLESNKISCWIAPRDINPGDNYATQIVHAIRDCKALILIASESTNSSGHVSNEVSIAFDNKKLIVPFKIEKFTFSDEYLYFLSRKLWIEAHQNFSEGLRQLAETLNVEEIKTVKEKVSEKKVIESIHGKPDKPSYEDSDRRRSALKSKSEIAASIVKIANKYCHNSLSLFSHQRDFLRVKEYANSFLKQSFTVSRYNKVIKAENIIDFLTETISDDSDAETVKIVGAPGSAKSALVQTAFYDTLMKYENSDGILLPFYISLNYYENKCYKDSNSEEELRTAISDDMAGFLEYIKASDDIVPVLFVDGVREHYTGTLALDNILMEIIDDTNIHKCVISIDTGVVKNRSRLKRVIPLVSNKVSACFESHMIDMHDENTAKRFIDSLLAFNSYEVSAEEVFCEVKRLKYQEIDAFIVLAITREIMEAENLENISEMYERWALTEFRGNENTLKSAAENSFNYVYKKDYDLLSGSFNHPQWKLIHRHRSYLDMLIVKHLLYTIESYKKTEYCFEIFDVMLTASSDRFLSDYLKDNYALQEKILDLVTEKYDEMSPVQRSSAMFWLAKLTYKNLIADALGFLRPKFQAMMPLVKKTDNTSKENYDNQFTFRAMCFAMSIHGQTQTLDDYICLLITNDSAHAINRGAIVEYYSDQHQMATNESYYLDTDLKLGGKAIDALIWKVNIELMPGKKKFPELDLVTLASLLQKRIQTNQSQRIPKLNGWVNEFLSAMKKYKVRPQHIKSEKIEYYFDSMCEDFCAFLDSSGNFDIPQIMYNTLKNLKDVKRKQWTRKNIFDPESVSEHIYNSWMMAMLFLPQETIYEEYSKKEILDMLLIHDIAEAKLGDLVIDLNEPSIELREQNAVMRKLMVKGSYPDVANLTYYYNVWTGYYKGLNINSKIARDINLVQTVYTFCEYCMRYPQKFSVDDIAVWTSEKDKLETDIGFSIYEKLVENNSDFDLIFREDPEAWKQYSDAFQSDKQKISAEGDSNAARSEIKTRASDYRILSYTELQISNANIDSIKTEIAGIVSSVFSKQSYASLENNLKMLESISENWRIILNEKDELVGYWVFVALPDNMYDEAKIGLLDENNITLDTIEYIDFPGTYNGYLLMSGTKPEARTATLVQILYDSLARHIEDLAQKGIFFREIVCVAETASGKSAIKKMGLSEICDHTYGGKVLSVDMTDVSSNRYFSSFEKLKRLYCNYFKNNSKRYD